MVALTRFLEWHDANPRKLVGTEEKFETVVDLAAVTSFESLFLGTMMRTSRPRIAALSSANSAARVGTK